MLNKKSIGILLAALIFPVAASAAPPPVCKGVNVLEELKTTKPALYKEITIEGAKFKNDNALLWRIEKTGIKSSHLFGTIHITDPRVHNLSATTKAAFNSSRVLILEAVNLNDATMGKAMMSVMAQSMFNPAAGKDLSDYLTKDEMAKALEVSAQMGFPAAMVKIIKPWLIAISLALPPCEAKRAKAGLLSLDARLEADAKAQGKPAIGLETPKEQLEIMAAIPLDDQVVWLKSSLEQYQRSEDYLETMIELYLKRNLGQMFPLSIKASKNPATAAKAMESFQTQLVDKRNHNMVERAKPEIDKGNAFIAVGALHLGGDQGIIELLRKEGYTVTAVE